MNANISVVVAGSGAAGHAAVTTLRREGFAGRITMLHGEPHPPYNRTLVNKAVLQGTLTPQQIALPALDGLDVELIPERATGVRSSRRTITVESGATVGYDALIVATGSRARTSGLPGGPSGDRAFQLHTVTDAEALRTRLGDRLDHARVAVLGAGFIGSETASYLSGAGATVDLVSRSSAPLAQSLGRDIASRVLDLHQENVTTHVGHRVTHFTGGGDAAVLVLDTGRAVEADIVVLAHGTVPASAWLTGDNAGIRVDDRLRALGRPDVYAAGGVAVHTSSDGLRYRIDHWDAASAQGVHAARTVLHDQFAAPDPGFFATATGFTLNLYATPIAGYGVALPGGLEQQHSTEAQGSILTTFATATGVPVGAAGLRAGRELLAVRQWLARP